MTWRCPDCKATFHLSRGECSSCGFVLPPEALARLNLLCPQVLKRTWPGRTLLISMVLLAVVPSAMVAAPAWGLGTASDVSPRILPAILVITAVITCSLALVTLTLICAVRMGQGKGR